MVSKWLYGHYLTSYEQFKVFQKIKIGFTSLILSEKLISHSIFAAHKWDILW